MVHRNGRITVRRSCYSIPARFIGTKVRVRPRVNEVWVFDKRRSSSGTPG